MLSESVSWSCISFSQINAFTYSLKFILVNKLLPTLDDYLPFSPFTHIPLLTINHPPSSQQLTFWFLPRGLQTEVFFSQIYTLTANSGVSSLVVVCRETEARDVGGEARRGETSGINRGSVEQVPGLPLPPSGYTPSSVPECLT